MPAAVAPAGALGDRALPAVGDQRGVQLGVEVEHRGEAHRRPRRRAAPRGLGARGIDAWLRSSSHLGRFEPVGAVRELEVRIADIRAALDDRHRSRGRSRGCRPTWARAPSRRRPAAPARGCRPSVRSGRPAAHEDCRGPVTRASKPARRRAAAARAPTYAAKSHLDRDKDCVACEDPPRSGRARSVGLRWRA
jgi:hypothetical protein